MKLHHIALEPTVAPSGTLVLLHGYGADHNDLIPLAQELDPALRVVSLQAPHALGAAGRAWFNLQQTERGFAFDPAEADAALLLAVEAVEEIASGAFGAARPLLLGFSQGAAVALSVALTRPSLVRGVLALSGVPPALDEARLAPAADLKNLPVFAAHGLYDPLLPIALGRLMRDALAQKGLAVEWHEYPMAHQVVAQELADARAWLAALRARGG